MPYPTDITKTITPLGLNGTAEYFIHTLGMDIEKEQLMGIMAEYMLDAYFYKIHAKANVISTLKALKASGASLNVLTASPHITMDACLKRLGMWELFIIFGHAMTLKPPKPILIFTQELPKE